MQTIPEKIYFNKQYWYLLKKLFIKIIYNRKFGEFGLKKIFLTTEHTKKVNEWMEVRLKKKKKTQSIMKQL